MQLTSLLVHPIFILVWDLCPMSSFPCQRQRGMRNPRDAEEERFCLWNWTSTGSFALISTGKMWIQTLPRWHRITGWIIHQICHGILSPGSDVVLFMGQISCLVNARTLHTTHDASFFLLLVFKKWYYHNVILRGISTAKAWLRVMKACTLSHCNFCKVWSVWWVCVTPYNDIIYYDCSFHTLSWKGSRS